MNCAFLNWVRSASCLALCVILAGCAVGIDPYPQSIETAVQTVLAKQGYYQGPIDGAAGPSTSRAIRNYQRDHHLTPTGTINPALVASMGLAGPQYVGPTAYYPGYPAYYSTYAAPAYYAPPAVIGIGWGGGWGGGCWNRGWGGGGYCHGWR